MVFIYCTPTFLLCLDYVSIGPRFSNIVLQALLVLLRKQPPAVSHSLPPSLLFFSPSLPPSSQRHRLLILGTTSLPDRTLESLGIENAFSSSVSVQPVTQGSEVLEILKVNYSSVHCNDVVFVSK